MLDALKRMFLQRTDYRVRPPDRPVSVDSAREMLKRLDRIIQLLENQQRVSFLKKNDRG